MNDRPANPWHDATEKPKVFPILYRTRSGRFDVMISWLYPCGRCCRNWRNVTQWKVIEVPPDLPAQVAEEKNIRNRPDLEHPDLYKGPGRPARRLEGQRFGRLTVLSRSPIQPRQHACWTCRCDCGKTVRVSSCQLTLGFKRSCGCLRKKHVRALALAQAETP